MLKHELELTLRYVYLLQDRKHLVQGAQVSASQV